MDCIKLEWINGNGKKEGSGRECFEGSHCGGGWAWQKCYNENVMVTCHL
jgi:hypothetical protein